MEQVEERQLKLIYHKFYCDECGKFLGERCEDENGQYINPYKFDLIRLSKGTLFDASTIFEIDGEFCYKCKGKKYEWLKEQLVKIGFKKTSN